MSRPLRRHQWPKLVLINGKSEAAFLLYYFIFVHVSFFGKVLENSQYIWFLPGMFTIWALDQTLVITCTYKNPYRALL